MYRAARALVIQSPYVADTQSHSAADILSKISDFGIISETVQAGSHVDFTNIEALPDVVILDVANAPDKSVMVQYSKKLSRNALSDMMPVAVISDVADFTKFDAHVHLDQNLPAHILAKKLKHAIRIAAMRLEYARRVETAAQFGIKAPPLQRMQSEEAERLLVVGRSERYFQLASLFQGTAKLKVVETFNDAQVFCAEETYDCLIIDTLVCESFDIDALKQFKLDTRFFNLPVLLLQEGLDIEEQEVLTESGICDLFDLHGDTKEIASYTRTLIQAERTRTLLLRAFKTSIFKKICDPITKLARPPFFEKHLEKVLNQSSNWRVPVAFGIFDISLSFDTGTIADDSRREAIYGQIGQTIALLVRLEDSATHLGDGRFVIAAPNSTSLAIAVLISRISSVLSMTTFSAGGEIGKISIATNYFETQPGEALQSVMNRLKDA